MANISNSGGAVSTITAWMTTPTPQYVQASDVSFAGGSGIVLPHALPPSSMRFATPEDNKMLNLPGIMSIFENRRNGMTF